MPSEKAAGVFAMSPSFGRFADIIVSGDEGLVKPDPQIYALACRRCALEPSQLLFIDDNLANIEAAKAMGLATHRFEDPDALWPALKAHGLV
jgi:HAD superfamily hydrolase (TIGR01509 family)